MTFGELKKKNGTNHVNLSLFMYLFGNKLHSECIYLNFFNVMADEENTTIYLKDEMWRFYYPRRDEIINIFFCCEYDSIDGQNQITISIFIFIFFIRAKHSHTHKHISNSCHS